MLDFSMIAMKIRIICIDNKAICIWLFVYGYLFSFVAGMYVEEFGVEMLNITEAKSM